MTGTDNLSSAVKLLGEELRVLPAAGGATEYLQQPDADEKDDQLIHDELSPVDEYGETSPPATPRANIEVTPIRRTEQHLYRYFIDGSLRTYFLCTGVERDRTFPVLLAQIGATCLHRREDGQLRLHSNKTRILLLVPKGGNGISDRVWEGLQKLNAPDGSFKVIDTNQETAHTMGGRDIDLRTRAGGIARNRMHKLELELIESTDQWRDADTWVILDGAVKLDEFVKQSYLIGAAKSFTKEPEFHFGGRGSKRNLDIITLLEHLDYAHRTPAFSSYGGKVAFWYVRLWPYKELDYPLMGVVKVELPTPDRQPADSELITELSSCLVGERSVTPYGQDARWHSHLYPIYCAENATKSRFMSKQVLLGHVRWGTGLNF